jgi:hypothetical protein
MGAWGRGSFRRGRLSEQGEEEMGSFFSILLAPCLFDDYGLI